ncbi:6-bladed beta-propeller [candidate division KSB1 bacterium]
MKHNNCLIRGTTFIILVLLLQNAAFSQRIENIDGVRTVINEKTATIDIDNNDYLKFIRKIGDLESSDENQMFYKPSDIALDDEGNIYIMDTGNFKVKKFNSEGEFILSFGNRGEGPGEFLQSVSIEVNNDGNIVVLDKTNQRFEVFSKKGIRISDFKFEKMPSLFKINSTGEYVVHGRSVITLPVIGSGKRPDDMGDESILQICKKDGLRLRELGVSEEFGNPISNIRINSVEFDVDKGDNVFLSYTYKNLIEKYSSEGILLLKITRPLNYPITKQEKKSIESYLEEMLKNKVMINTVSTGIAVDDQDNIWVITLNRQKKEAEEDLIQTDMYDLEIIDKNGVLQGKIHLDHYADDIEIFGDRLFILDRNNSMCFYEYKILN